MNKLKSLFEHQKYIEIIDIVTPVLENTSKLTPSDHLDYLLYYGISLIEYSFTYQVEFNNYQTQIADYNYLVKNSQADPVAFKDIPQPISYVNRSYAALSAALSLILHYFPDNLNYLFITRIHLIRAAHLQNATSFPSLIDSFIDFIAECDSQKFEFNRFADCLKEMLEFQISDAQAKMIKQELYWYYSEMMCSEMKKMRWYGAFCKFNSTGQKVEEYRQQICEFQHQE